MMRDIRSSLVMVSLGRKLEDGEVVEMSYVRTNGKAV